MPIYREVDACGGGMECFPSKSKHLNLSKSHIWKPQIQQNSFNKKIHTKNKQEHYSYMLLILSTLISFTSMSLLIC